MLKPVSRRELLHKFRAVGFQGPFSGGKHLFMRKGSLTVRIPNPHGTDISVPLLRELLRQAQVSPSEWHDA